MKDFRVRLRKSLLGRETYITLETNTYQGEFMHALLFDILVLIKRLWRLEASGVLKRLKEELEKRVSLEEELTNINATINPHSYDSVEVLATRHQRIDELEMELRA